jgi:UDP-N-acetylglucosamine 4-epimerase
MKVALTGGAGFIGSNLADALIEIPGIERIIVLDNLSTGFRRNIEHLIGHPKFEFHEGDIRSIETCRKIFKGCTVINHQAALGSVPRSILDPVTSNEVNVNGFLNILQVAREQKIRKVIYASSSSVYGDLVETPKCEDRTGRPLSPYAVTKCTNELYAEVFARQFDMDITGFRYFNVFGPKQSPNGAYAAVIPLFVKAALEQKKPLINGDGSNSRDFTYVKNVVQIHKAAVLSEYKHAHTVYNVACGKATTLNDLWKIIARLTGAVQTPTYMPERVGDIPHSVADISRASRDLNYTRLVSIEDGLFETIDWYKHNLNLL